MQANFEQKSQTLKEIVLKNDDSIGFYSTFFWACAIRVVYPARACMSGKCFSVYSRDTSFLSDEEFTEVAFATIQSPENKILY